MPATVASAVIRIGRSRRSPARIMPPRRQALAPYRWSASSQQDAVLGDIPITMMSPMNDKRLNVVRVDQEREEHADRGGMGHRSDRLGGSSRS